MEMLFASVEHYLLVGYAKEASTGKGNRRTRRRYFRQKKNSFLVYKERAYVCKLEYI